MTSELVGEVPRNRITLTASGQATYIEDKDAPDHPLTNYLCM